MHRRAFLSLAAGAALSGRAASSKPNILLLMADQFRSDALGCDGNAQIYTPHLDQLASEGARFRCAYSCTPTCTPARAALLTGLSPWRHGLLGYGKVAERYPVEMPRLLKSAGYFTAVIGKCHYTPQRNTHGFDEALLDESGREESIDFRSGSTPLRRKRIRIRRRLAGMTIERLPMRCPKNCILPIGRRLRQSSFCKTINARSRSF
jgi:hypothetical protein